MPKARKVLSDPDLFKYSEEHLQYEISMLISCARLFDVSFSIENSFSATIRNAIVEAFAIHVRNLLDFLYPDPKHVFPTDVIAQDFVPNTTVLSLPVISDSLKDARRRVHKQVSHLTSERPYSNDPGKNWHTALVGEIIYVLMEFNKAADPLKLAPSVGHLIIKLRSEMSVGAYSTAAAR